MVIGAQNLAEFWAVCTRPATARGGYGLTPRAAMHRLRLIERAFHRLPESDGAVDIWKDLLTTYSVSGVETHDARLVALMKVHGVIKIVTFNISDFSRYPAISAVHPANL
jgi:predicted nucleic acid-binding protein